MQTWQRVALRTGNSPQSRRYVVGWWRPGIAPSVPAVLRIDRFSREDPVHQGSAANDELSVDHDVKNSFRVFLGIEVACTLGNLLGIEKNQIGIRSYLEPALLLHGGDKGLQALRRHQAHLADCLRKRER